MNKKLLLHSVEFQFGNMGGDDVCMNVIVLNTTDRILKHG